MLTWGVRRLGRVPLAAILFFGGTLFPALGFFNVYPMRYSYVADHFQYLASLGPIALFACGLAQLPRLLAGAGREVWERRLTVVGSACVVVPLVLVLCGLTRHRLQDFADLRALWERTLAKNPESETAHHNLGVLDYKAGDIETARRQFERCTEIDACPEGHHGLALILQRKGDLVGAIEHAEAAAKGLPTGKHLVLVADLAFDLQRYSQAAAAYRQAAQRQPLVAAEQIRHAEALMHLGDGLEAIVLLQEVVAKDAQNQKAHYDLGIVCAAVDRIAEAEQHFQRVIALNPKEPAGYFRLGELYADHQRWNDALSVYDQGLQELPDSVELSGRRDAVFQRVKNGIRAP